MLPLRPICLTVLSGYKCSSDNSRRSPPNGYGLASSTASPSKGGTDSATSEVGRDTGSEAPSGGGIDLAILEVGGTIDDSSTYDVYGRIEGVMCR